MKIKLQSFIAAGILILTNNIQAQVTPLKLSADARIEVVAYSQYNVVPIQGTTYTTTQITFGKNEYITNVQNGDLGAWTASINKDMPNMMFIKPTAYGSNTNMTVVTDQHTYYFHLSSNQQGQDNQDSATYALHFIYPEQEKQAVEKQIIQREQQKQAELSAFKNPSEYNWGYSFNGDKSIVPIHVFDDGKFTYLQLQPGQDVPAIFAVSNPDGHESVVNYRQDGQYIIVQQVSPQLTLRLGKDHVATIFNTKLINKLNSNEFNQ